MYEHSTAPATGSSIEEEENKFPAFRLYTLCTQLYCMEKKSIKFNIWPAVSKKRRRRRRLDMTRIDPSLSEKKKKRTKAFFSFGVKIFWRKKKREENRLESIEWSRSNTTEWVTIRHDTERRDVECVVSWKRTIRLLFKHLVATCGAVKEKEEGEKRRIVRDRITILRSAQSRLDSTPLRVSRAPFISGRLRFPLPQKAIPADGDSHHQQQQQEELKKKKKKRFSFLDDRISSHLGMEERQREKERKVWLYLGWSKGAIQGQHIHARHTKSIFKRDPLTLWEIWEEGRRGGNILLELCSGLVSQFQKRSSPLISER